MTRFLLLLAASILVGCAAPDTGGSDHAGAGAETAHAGTDVYTLPDVWYAEVALLESFEGDGAEFIHMVSAIAGLNQPLIHGSQPESGATVFMPVGYYTALDLIMKARAQLKGVARVQASVRDSRVIMEFES